MGKYAWRKMLKMGSSKSTWVLLHYFIGIDYIEELVELAESNLTRDKKMPSDVIELRTADGWKGLK